MIRLIALLGVVVYGAELRWDPDQIVRSLRDASPAMPATDCQALGISACNSQFPQPVKDISIRWVQLDNDPELEAIVIARADPERTYFAFVFDFAKSWNLAGVIECFRFCLDPDFIIVGQLTDDSPILVIAKRDFGGSGQILWTQTCFRVQTGKLVEVFKTTLRNYVGLGAGPRRDTRTELHSSGKFLIERTTPSACRVLAWNKAQSTFTPVVSNLCKAVTAHTH